MQEKDYMRMFEHTYKHKPAENCFSMNPALTFTPPHSTEKDSHLVAGLAVAVKRSYGVVTRGVDGTVVTSQLTPKTALVDIYGANR